MLTETVTRFQDEAETINAYVDYIENNFYRRSHSVIRTHGFEPFEILNEYSFFTDNKEEKEKNKEIIDELNSIIRNKIDSLQTKLAQMQTKDLPPVSENITTHDLLTNLHDYIESTVYDCIDNPDNLPYYELINSITPLALKQEVDDMDGAAEEKYYDMLNEDDYKSMLLHMKAKLYNDDIEDTRRELEEYTELKTLYSIFNDNNPINLYRQAFILLMTAFDAAVFDIFSEIFEQNFFGIAKHINHDKKYTIGDIVNFSDFETFTSNTIQAMLSGKYVSDILEIMCKYKKDVFCIEGVDQYECIMEYVQRRNLHVHKRGIVDQKYFTKGNGSELGIHLNDYAIIDSSYYYNAFEILTGFISNVPV